MHYKVIACEVLFREICHCAARSVNTLEPEFITQGYHDNPDIGRERLQDMIDAVDPEKCAAVLLGYGLCSNLTVGLVAQNVPLVIPRGHDCITLLLGSKERYAEVFNQHPGTYFYSAGWLEYHQRGGERVEPTEKSGLAPSSWGQYEDMVKKYGEDNAKYIMETLGGWAKNYTHGVLIDFEFQKHLDSEERVRKICSDNTWEFERIPGSLDLIQRWLDGQWDESDFVVVKPGEVIKATADERVIDCQRLT